LPRAMRFLARRLGVLDPNGAGVLSYLLFERGYCRRLIDLGFADGMCRREEILDFLGYGSAADRKASVQRPRRPAERKEAVERPMVPERSVSVIVNP
jgi:hypothetical protein